MSAPHHHHDADHRALVYRDPARFVERIGAYLRDGLREGDRVMAAVTPEKRDWLREDLGTDAAAIDFADVGELYWRHGPMLASLVAYLERHGTPGRGRVRVVAEQELTSRAAADVRAYMRYEAAFNVAYSQFNASVLCPYDAERLPEAIIEDALRTHPDVLDNGSARRSELFMDPRAFVRDRVRARPVPAGVEPYGIERAEDVSGARALVRAKAEAAGLPTPAIQDLELAVSEVATNALQHGRAPRRVWSYVEDGELVCHVRDAGPGPPDPLTGYLPPDTRSLRGRGLWLAHQLCDIVEIASNDARNDVYLYVRVGAAADVGA
jgi:anti-sigma regulatory factor (Ser/Thr protein kinase)